VVLLGDNDFGRIATAFTFLGIKAFLFNYLESLFFPYEWERLQITIPLPLAGCMANGGRIIYNGGIR
jgi:hypothetical protein